MAHPVLKTDPPLSLTALCIDDSDLDLMLNERVLRRSGVFDVILKFNTVDGALAYLRDHKGPADAIFLDVNMPAKNGFDFLEAATAEFGADFARCVVIMLTSSLNQADADKADEFDAVRDFMTKPLSVAGSQQVAEWVRTSHYRDGGTTTPDM